MQRIYLVRQDGAVSNVHMPYDLAIEKLRAGEIEEVYDKPGVPQSFKGVRLRESPLPANERFHRGSTFNTDCCLTESDSLGNAGALGQIANRIASDRVCKWPIIHDTLAVVISAGRVFQPSPA